MATRVREVRDEYRMSRSKTYDLQVKEHVARMAASFIHCQMRTTNDWTISCLISSAYARRNAGSYIWPVSGMPCVCS